MLKETELQKSKEQYPEFFKKLPTKLLRLVLSEEITSQISEICLKNGVEEEEKIEKIAYYITFVLLSQLPPETLPKTLEREVKISSETAEKISEEASRVIFAQVKDELDKLYPSTTKPEKTTPLPEEKPKKPPKKDIYKEPIE